MDQLQQLLCDMCSKQPNCIAERSVLRATLADYLPNNRLQQNLILSAFDIDVVSKLQTSTDTTLNALNLISQMENDYGVIKDAAIWTIESWCCMLNFEATAVALNAIRPVSSNQTPQNQEKRTLTEYTIGLGIYRAGTDFPCGEVEIQVTKVPERSLFYGIGKNPNRIIAANKFKDKIYARIENGQYIKLEAFEDGRVTFSVKPVE